MKKLALKSALLSLLAVVTAVTFSLHGDTVAGAELNTHKDIKLSSVENILTYVKEEFAALAETNLRKVPLVDNAEKPELALARSVEQAGDLQLKLNNNTPYNLHDVVIRLQMSDNLPLTKRGALELLSVDAAAKNAKAEPLISDKDWLPAAQIPDLAALAEQLANNNMELAAEGELPKIEVKEGELVLGLKTLASMTELKQTLSVKLPDNVVPLVQTTSKAKKSNNVALLMLVVLLMLFLFLLLLFLLLRQQQKRRRKRQLQMQRKKKLQAQRAMQEGAYTGESTYAKLPYGVEAYAADSYNTATNNAQFYTAAENLGDAYVGGAAADSAVYETGTDFNAAEYETATRQARSNSQFKQFVLFLSLLLAAVLVCLSGGRFLRQTVAAGDINATVNATMDKESAIHAESKALEAGLEELLAEVRKTDKRLSAPLVYAFTMDLPFGDKQYTLSGTLAYRIELDVPKVSPNQVDAVLAKVNEQVTSSETAN